VAYAAKAGTVAADGKGKHSPYAEALLSTLATPGLDIRLVMGRVRDLVVAKTGGTQEPFVYGSLGGANVALVSPGPGGAGGAGADGADAKAVRDYELAAKIGTNEAWDAFLAAHPTGFHAELARVQRAKLTAPIPTKASPPNRIEQRPSGKTDGPKGEGVSKKLGAKAAGMSENEWYRAMMREPEGTTTWCQAHRGWLVELRRTGQMHTIAPTFPAHFARLCGS
jgi:hypothetical protein